MLLYEKYRPQTFGDVLGQDKAVKTITNHLERWGWGGQAYWISGASGTGKTTLARIVANLGADPEFGAQEFDSGDTLDAASLDEINRTMRMYTWGGKSGHAYIVNEAHAIRGLVLRRLLGLLERIPKNVIWIFTTTNDGQDQLFDKQVDASPLFSRCVEIRLTNQGLCKPFATLAQKIAHAENLDGRPIAAYETLAKTCKNNMRMMLQQIAAGAMAE